MGFQSSQGSQGTRPPQNKVPDSLKGRCFVCGGPHLKSECPRKANETTCSLCKRKGHIPSGWCRIRLEKEQKGEKARESKEYRDETTNKARKATRDGEESTSEDEAVGLIARCRGATCKVALSRPTPKLHARVRPKRGLAFDFGLTPDTGATRSIIATNLCRQNKVSVKPTSCRLYNASDVEMKVEGEAILWIEGHEVNALVSGDLKDEILLSWHDLQTLGVIPRNFPCLPNRDEAKAVENKVRNSNLKSRIDSLKAEFQDVLGDELGKDEALEGPPHEDTLAGRY